MDPLSVLSLASYLFFNLSTSLRSQSMIVQRFTARSQVRLTEISNLKAFAINFQISVLSSQILGRTGLSIATQSKGITLSIQSVTIKVLQPLLTATKNIAIRLLKSFVNCVLTVNCIAINVAFKQRLNTLRGEKERFGLFNKYFAEGKTQ